MNLFISPHNDDETLFGAFTLMREKPLVLMMTDSYIQPNRGEKGCSARERREETLAALKLIGCPVVFAGLRDDALDTNSILGILSSFDGFEKVYAPAVQGGNPQHDMIGEMARQVFYDKLVFYTTYSKEELWTKGDIEVVPTLEELGLKNRMLECYTSQLYLPATRPHFLAIKDKSEWLISKKSL